MLNWSGICVTFLLSGELKDGAVLIFQASKYLFQFNTFSEYFCSWIKLMSCWCLKINSIRGVQIVRYLMFASNKELLRNWLILFKYSMWFPASFRLTLLHCCQHEIGLFMLWLGLLCGFISLANALQSSYQEKSYKESQIFKSNNYSYFSKFNVLVIFVAVWRLQ